MSVLHVIEQAHQRTGSVSWNAAGSSQRVFQVTCSVGTDDDSVVLAAVDPHTALAIPSLLAAHPTRSLLAVSNLACRWLSTDGHVAEVTVTYDWDWNLMPPWELPVQYNASQTTYEQIVDKDLVTGLNICNSANEPFDPPLMATRYNWTLEAVKNYNSIPTFLGGVVGRVNSSSFYGFPAGQVMCTGAPMTQQQTVYGGATTFYWTVTYSFASNNISYQPLVLDAGFKRLSSDGSKLITIIMPDGKEPSSPVPLNGSGQPLDLTDESGEPSALHFITFNVYPTFDFNSLGV